MFDASTSRAVPQADTPWVPPKPPQQYRPGPTTKVDNRLYAPQRDLAYLFPAAVREAFNSLDKANWMGYYAELLTQHGITEEMLGEGVKRFVSAFNFFVGDPAVRTFDDALDRTQFFAVPNLVRIMIFERLGEVMSVGFFLAVRDTARFGENPPQTEELAGMVKAIHDFVGRLNGTRGYLQARDKIEQAASRVPMLEFKLETTTKSLANQQKLTAEANQEIDRLRKELRAEQRLGFWRKLLRVVGK